MFIILLRIAIVFGLIYFAIKLFTWVPQLLSSTKGCPNCDGKGYWYGTREREECKQCNGSGRVPK